MVEIVDLRHIHHVHVGTIVSPAFTAPHPVVRHIELIPADIRDAMRPAWETTQFSARDISVYKVFDVTVTAEGLVFSHEGKIIAQTLTQHSPEECKRAHERILKSEQVEKIDTSCLLMRKRGDNNYGHWLIEVLPKLNLTRSLCHVSGLAIPDVHGAMGDIIRDTLDLSDKIQTTPRFKLDSNKVFFFKELIIMFGISEHGSYMSPLILSEMNNLSQNTAAGDIRKIFISRRGAPRNVLQEDSVERLLESRGFSIVNPGKMSLHAQISLFKGAETVIGVMGAGMTNIAFAPKESHIINLSPATMPDTFFYFLATHRQQLYSELRGENLNDSSSWDEKFSINLKDILAEID